MQFQELYTELLADQSRNNMVCDDVLRSLRDGRSPLVLTERNEHLDLLATQLSSCVQHFIVLRGGMNRKEVVGLAEKLQSIPENESRIILATGKFIGEGFDDARLDTLFLTLPVSWKGTIAQYAGRLHRAHHAKREVLVYDYADLNVDFLCDDANLVIELDGLQHLKAPEAYRRDRRKDWLLQEHGYYILRFLTEDITRHLDDVLDVILRTLQRRLPK